jgi:hypothetical protein
VLAVDPPEVPAPDADAALVDPLELGVPEVVVPEADAALGEGLDAGVDDVDVPGFWEPAVEPVSLMDIGVPPKIEP